MASQTRYLNQVAPEVGYLLGSSTLEHFMIKTNLNKVNVGFKTTCSDNCSLVLLSEPMGLVYNLST